MKTRKTRTEGEILKSIINDIKAVLGNTLPTKDELIQFAAIQKNKYNFTDDFLKEVLCEICFEIPIGKKE